MRALLDEQLPVELGEAIRTAGPRHQVSSVAEEGWRGVKNGELLRRLREADSAHWLRRIGGWSINRTSPAPEWV